jgi:hypothetical protein
MGGSHATWSADTVEPVGSIGVSTDILDGRPVTLTCTFLVWLVAVLSLDGSVREFVMTLAAGRYVACERILVWAIAMFF